MLIRRTVDGAIAITQLRHAWLAGELARGWGAPGFAVPEPRNEMFCAVGLHDIGWLEWDQTPELDPQSGYPLQFDQVEATVHTALWSRGVEAALLYGMLPALHISRHGVAIYELTFESTSAQPEQAEAVRAFIQDQQAFQDSLIAQLTQQPGMAPHLQADQLNIAKRFIVAVDTLSLNLCWGIRGPLTIENVPSRDGMTRISLARISEGQVMIDPWPFAVDTLQIEVEGKALRLAHDQINLDILLRDAPIFAERLTLVPRGADGHVQ